MTANRPERFISWLLPLTALACVGTDTTEDPGSGGAGGSGGAFEVVCEGDLAVTPWDVVTDETFLRGPYLQSVMGDAAVVVWRDVPGGPEGCVFWSLPGEAEQSTCTEADGLGQYDVRLQPLPRDTLVTYRVGVADRETADLSFRTAPVDARPVRLAVFADAHNNEATLDTIASQALDDGVDAVVAIGDSVSQPEEVQFDQFFNGLRPLLHRVPLWPAIGNHEALGQAYFDAIVVPGAGEDLDELYYGVRFGDVWIGALDLLDFSFSAALSKDMAEVAWLKAALSSPEAGTARWRLLFIHQPPYSVGWGHCDGYHGEPSLREVLIPLAVEHDVTAIFSGHMHGYEHGSAEGVHLFVTGGAGGGLDMSCETPPDFPEPWLADYSHHHLVVDASCDALTVEARRLDGSVIETTTLGDT